MTVLNIYSLDDPNEQHLVASLGVGSHVIGRGALLQVADKRVSRKHAIIEVTDKKIILTSIHINPCFFKAANSRSLIVITQNKNNEINDGDQFALLPENCWYKVKIKTEASDEPHQSVKRVHETENNNTCDPKKARLCSDANQTALDTATNGSTTEICSTTPKIELEENMECQLTGIDISEETNSSTLPNIEYTDDLHHQDSTAGIHNDETLFLLELQRRNPSSPKSDIEAHSNEIALEVKEELLESSDNMHQAITQEIYNESSVPVVEEQTGNLDNPEASIEAHTEVQQLLDVQQLNDTESAVEAHEDVVPLEIKEEPLEVQPLEANEAGLAKAESSVPQTVEIKIEPVEGDIKDSTDHSTVKAQENEEARILPPEVGPSTSGTANVQTTDPRREKCWYGESCYRKNPNHKAAFSHPGDADYSSADQDNRDQCPYGSTCFRRNLEHRRIYRHDTRPALNTRPSNVSVTFNLNRRCPFCPHCRATSRRGYKSDCESD